MTEIKPHGSHLGSFDAVVEGGRLTGVRPFAPRPLPGQLMQSIARRGAQRRRASTAPMSARAG